MTTSPKKPSTTPSPGTAVATAPELPHPVSRRGITEAAWRTLDQLYPGAASDSKLAVWDYCVARRLDPMKKPCHIVPMRVKDAKSGNYDWRDVIMPGIYELRTTAMRTEVYCGQSKPEFGPEVEFMGMKVPQWCEITVYRWSDKLNEKVAYWGRAEFSEVVVLTKDKEDANRMVVNDRWSRAPRQMLAKCCEADALRRAFPDEFGGVYTREEMEGRVIDVTPEKLKPPPPKKPETQAPQPATAAPAKASEDQLEHLKELLAKTGVPDNLVLARFEVGELTELTFEQIGAAIQFVNDNKP
jgi:phage recombination protein Bet